MWFKAGMTYCAMGALSLLQKTDNEINLPTILNPQSQRFEAMLKWLVSRQTAEIEEDSENDEADAQDGSHHPEEAASVSDLKKQTTTDTTTLNDQLKELSITSPPDRTHLTWTGFNGRLNKLADTCYCFWVTGALGVRHAWN